MVASDADAKLTILFPIKIANKTSSNQLTLHSALLAPERHLPHIGVNELSLRSTVSEALKNADKIIMITSIK